ncbi:hypothetical protein J6590_001377 [Homalodisca vitripennis]|nr:hypothetical protein J6590_001377 [Homalodisca vitripennis]
MGRGERSTLTMDDEPQPSTSAQSSAIESHHREVLSVVIDCCRYLTEEMLAFQVYVDHRDTFGEIKENVKPEERLVNVFTSGDTIGKNLSIELLKTLQEIGFDKNVMIITAELFKILSPVTVCLQSKIIDYGMIPTVVSETISKLQSMRTDEGWDKMVGSFILLKNTLASGLYLASNRNKFTSFPFRDSLFRKANISSVRYRQQSITTDRTSR